MPSSRPSRFVPRALAILVAGVALVSACDTTVGFSPSQQRWGFINIAALRNSAGEYRLAPNASFFRGSITSVPDARIRTDSCFAIGDYIPPSGGNILGVTYLDAGESISAKIGATTTTLPRIASGGALTYALAAGTTIPFTPGDSVVITIPGVAGGFPASEIRGRSAEPFTIDSIAPSTTSIPLKWTPATDPNSAIIVSLQYTPSGAGAKTQEIRCAYNDDGLDSIPLRQHQAWSATTNVDRAAVFTRLRTIIIPVTDGAMEIISTFVVPTPAP